MGLSPLQERVVREFFALPEAAGFALAGGSALVLQQVVERATRDLDLFGTEPHDVGIAAHALMTALTSAGLSCEELHRNPTFVRLRVADRDVTTDVDVSYDWQWLEPVATPLGPSRSPRELAVDKLLALFGRAQARDFVDVYFLARRFGIDEMIRWAPQKDAGFSPYFLAEGVGRMVRLPREEFEVDDVTFADMAEFYAQLRANLIQRTLGGERG